MTSTRLLAARTKIKTLVHAHQIAAVVVLDPASFSDPQNEETRRNSAGACEDVQKNRQGRRGSLSNSATREPYEKNESHDQSSGDQHPVLAFKTQKSKTLDEKLHRSRPRSLGRISGLFVQDKYFGDANILFFYLLAGEPR
jgi:hypothetical protein